MDLCLRHPVLHGGGSVLESHQLPLTPLDERPRSLASSSIGHDYPTSRRRASVESNRVHDRACRHRAPKDCGLAVLGCGHWARIGSTVRRVVVFELSASRALVPLPGGMQRRAVSLELPLLGDARITSGGACSSRPQWNAPTLRSDCGSKIPALLGASQKRWRPIAIRSTMAVRRGVRACQGNQIALYASVYTKPVGLVGCHRVAECL